MSPYFSKKVSSAFLGCKYFPPSPASPLVLLAFIESPLCAGQDQEMAQHPVRRETLPSGPRIPALGDRPRQPRSPRCVWQLLRSSPALSAPTLRAGPGGDQHTSKLLHPGRERLWGTLKRRRGERQRGCRPQFPRPRPHRTAVSVPRATLGLLDAGPAGPPGDRRPSDCTPP